MIVKMDECKCWHRILEAFALAAMVATLSTGETRSQQVQFTLGQLLQRAGGVDLAWSNNSLEILTESRASRLPMEPGNLVRL
jgi:hypothetical protein